MKSWLQKKDNKSLIKVYVQPGASKDSLAGFYCDPLRLKIKVSAPPVDGAANKSVIKFLSKLLKLSKSDFEIIRGETSRQKDLLINASYEDLSFKFDKLLEK